MKNWKKRMAAALLTAVMAAGVVANATPASAAILTAKQYLAKMEKASKKAKSYEAMQTTTLKASEAGQNVTYQKTVKLIIFQDPLKSKTVMTETLKGGGVDQSSKSVVYLKEDPKGNICVYASIDGSDYKEINLTDTDVTDIDSSATDLDISPYSGAKIVKKSVKVNNIDTVQISAKMTDEDKGKLLSSMLGMDSDQMEALGIDYKTLDPIKVTLWIDKKTYLPVKETIDVTAFVNGMIKSMYEAMGEESDLSCSTAKSTTTYKNFNKATKFKFPDVSK